MDYGFNFISFGVEIMKYGIWIVDK
jgi:hypothetical protein